MAEDVKGNNATTADPMVLSEKARLEAQVKSFEAKQVATITAPPSTAPAAATAAAPAQEQVVAIPEPPKPTVENKVDSLQQFRDKEGEVSLEKIEKANGHLEKGIQDKEARKQELLRLNKELQRKFTKTSQEMAKAEKPAPPESPQQLDLSRLTPEFRKQLEEDLQKDWVGTILKLAQNAARQEVVPLKSEWESTRSETLDRRHAEELDRLVEQGNEWILTEGLGAFEEVWQRKPFLRQSPTPYSDALPFVSRKPQAQAPDKAQVGPRTPILGGSHAVPPPSSQAPASPEQELKTLSDQLMAALSAGNKQLARELELKMDIAHSKAYPARKTFAV